MYQLAGETTHFRVFADPTDEAGQSLVDLILSGCEYDFNVIASAFPPTALPGLPFTIQVASQSLFNGADDARVVGIAEHATQDATEILLPRPR